MSVSDSASVRSTLSRDGELSSVDEQRHDIPAFRASSQQLRSSAAHGSSQSIRAADGRVHPANEEQMNRDDSASVSGSCHSSSSSSSFEGEQHWRQDLYQTREVVLRSWPHLSSLFGLTALISNRWTLNPTMDHSGPRYSSWPDRQNKVKVDRFSSLCAQMSLVDVWFKTSPSNTDSNAQIQAHPLLNENDQRRYDVLKSHLTFGTMNTREGRIHTMITHCLRHDNTRQMLYSMFGIALSAMDVLSDDSLNLEISEKILPSSILDWCRFGGSIINENDHNNDEDNNNNNNEKEEEAFLERRNEEEKGKNDKQRWILRLPKWNFWLCIFGGALTRSLTGLIMYRNQWNRICEKRELRSNDEIPTRPPTLDEIRDDYEKVEKLYQKRPMQEFLTDELMSKLFANINDRFSTFGLQGPRNTLLGYHFGHCCVRVFLTVRDWLDFYAKTGRNPRMSLIRKSVLAFRTAVIAASMRLLWWHWDVSSLEKAERMKDKWGYGHMTYHMPNKYSANEFLCCFSAGLAIYTVSGMVKWMVDKKQQQRMNEQDGDSNGDRKRWDGRF